MTHVWFGMIGRGCLLGLGAAAPIGPVNVEIARRTLRGGFRQGFALGCGAVTVDVGYAIVVSLTVRRALEVPNVVRWLGLGGAALLVYLGVMCLRAAGGAQPTGEGGADVVGKKAGLARNYGTGLALTSLNPMTLAFWFGAVPGFAGTLTTDPGRDLPLICGGVFAAAFSWVCAFAGLMHWAGGVGRDAGGGFGERRGRWLRVADVGGGLLLLAFAALMIWRVASGHLS